MPKTATYVLTWNPEQDCYTLYDHACENVPLLQGEGDAWFVWLAEHSSFAIQGKFGQLTLLKEARQRGGEGYWYAYRRQGKRMHKKYAGRSATLTPARLEAIARTLDTTTDAASILSPVSVVSVQEPTETAYQQNGVGLGRQRRGSSPPLPSQSYPKVARMRPVQSANSVEGSSSKWEPLLEPKLRLPRLHASLVERARLFSLLDVGRERKLTLLSAPAGSGKTTLVRQWVASRSLHGQFPPVAWVSLDAGDNDPARFWRYVITACRPFQADAGQFALMLLATTLHPPFKSLSLEEV